MPTTLGMDEVTVTRVPGPTVAGAWDDCDPWDGSKSDSNHGEPYPDDRNTWDC
ncbi:hypothetical protein FHU30_008571 [Actinomadura rupiterrae]|nr:hypothetical protein [Actinomadura rupiterrae]